MQRKSLILSFFLHIFFFIFLYFILLRAKPAISILPPKRSVSLSVVRKSTPIEQIVEAPEVIAPPVQEPVEPVKEKPREEVVEEAIPLPDPVEPSVESELSEELIPPVEVVEESRDSLALGDNFSYSYDSVSSHEIPTDFDLPQEDFLVDDLLLSEEPPREGSDSLYTIRLNQSVNRSILNTPEIVFERNDPVLRTLKDCQIAFSVTNEGLVRDIEMLPPGTGSETYDEILENLLSQILFSPGDRESGVIHINFSQSLGDDR
ncbi:MAG: hypothetical protein ACPKM1_13895 [Spirochaetaceae bacterium]